MAQNIGPTLILNIDATGTSEARPLVFNFANDPLILAGDTLSNSTPSISGNEKTPHGQPPLTYGAATLSGTRWTCEVSISNGSPNSVHTACCRALTAAGYTVEAFVPVVIEGVGFQPPASPIPGPAVQTPNTVYAGPPSSGNAPPTFRSLITADFPASGVTAGSYGDASHVVAVTVDTTGRATSASSKAMVVRDQGGQVFNVMADKYGAKGDGLTSTDDSVAINAAIADALAVSGEVFFPPPPGGTYNINNPLTITGTGTQTVSMSAPFNTTNHGININYNGSSNSSVVTMLGVIGCQFQNIGIQLATGLNNIVVWDTTFTTGSPSTNTLSRWYNCNTRFGANSGTNSNCIGWRMGQASGGTASSAYNPVWYGCNAFDGTTNTGNIGWQIGGSQAYSPQFYSCSFNTSCGVLCGPIPSYLTSALNINDTVLNVGDTLLFPSSGTVSIGGVQFSYTSKSVNFGPGQLNLASPSGSAFSSTVAVGLVVSGQGLYPGNCSFSFVGGGSTGNSMGYDFVIGVPGYAFIYGGQYQQTNNQRRFLQTGQAGSAFGVHVTVKQCVLKGYNPPTSVDNNGVFWAGNFATTLRLVDVTATGQTSAYSSSGYFLTTTNVQAQGSVLMENCEIFGTVPFINNTRNNPLYLQSVILTDTNGHTTTTLNNNFATPIVLTDAATVNLDLTRGDTFYLLTTSAIGATRNVTVSNAPLGTKTFRLFVQQPASGGPCAIGTWFTGNTVNWLEGVTPSQSTAANKIDQYEFSQPTSGVYVAKQILSGTPNLPSTVVQTNVTNNFTSNQQFSALVSVGVAPQAGISLLVQPAGQTLTSGTYNDINANLTNTPTSASTAVITAMAPTATWSGTAASPSGVAQAISILASCGVGTGGTVGAIRGAKTQALHNALGTITTLEAFNASVTNQAGGTVTLARGFYNQIQVSNSSVITTGYGIHLDVPSVATSGTIGQLYGMRVGNQGATGITNSTGIRIDAQSGSATTNKALDIAGGDVIMAGAVLPTNSTGGFLNIPTCAGTPTGTPTLFTGTVPLVFDTTNAKIWVYTGGAWKGVAVA